MRVRSRLLLIRSGCLDGAFDLAGPLRPRLLGIIRPLSSLVLVDHLRPRTLWSFQRGIVCRLTAFRDNFNHRAIWCMNDHGAWPCRLVLPLAPAPQSLLTTSDQVAVDSVADEFGIGDPDVKDVPEGDPRTTLVLLSDRNRQVAIDPAQVVS